MRGGDAKKPIVEIHRHTVGQRYRANAACLLESVAPPPQREGGLSLRSNWRWQPRGRQSVGRKTKVGRPHPVEHHTAHHEKRYGDADLQHGRYPMHTNRVAAPAAGIILHRRDQIGTTEANSRQQPEEHAHQQAQASRRGSPDGVEIHLLRNRHAHPPSSQRGDTKEHECAERASCSGEPHRLEEQMLDETPPARAECRANGQLALTAGAADQHHA